MKSLTLTTLSIAISFFSFNANAMDAEHKMSHASDMTLTAVQSKRLQTENNGPNSNDWVLTHKTNKAMHTGSASSMGLTAVQLKRMNTENDGPNSNDWVNAKSNMANHTDGLTAVQRHRLQTEDSGPNDNDWIKVTQR
jgi:hypothetical protein